MVELEADVDADEAPFLSNNFFTPARSISCGVQNVVTFDFICEYLFLVIVGV